MTITGQYQFDDSNESIGSWTFDLSAVSLGSISGTGGIVLESMPSSGYDVLEFDFGMLTFVVPDPADAGLMTGTSIGTVGTNPKIQLSSVDVTQASPTPEPASLFLLGTGLLGLGPAIRRRFTSL